MATKKRRALGAQGDLEQLQDELEEVLQAQRHVCLSVGSLADRTDLPATAYEVLQRLASDLAGQAAATLEVMERLDQFAAALHGPAGTGQVTSNK